MSEQEWGHVEVALVAGELSRDLSELLLACPADRSFVAADVPWSRPGPTGNVLCRLSERGLLDRSTDRERWGRARYVFSPFGLAVRAALALGSRQ